jgi:5'-3' exonuclease
MYDHMLIDARNALYRAIYAGLSDEQFTRSKHDSCVIFFRFVATYLHKFKTKAVHFFWDAPKDTIWRKAICEDYKEGRDVKADVDALLKRNSEICRAIIAAANCRNYARTRQEADDLIFAFCRHNSGSKILIVSSDSDFKQILWLMRFVDIYNPNNKNGKLADAPDHDPVDLRSLAGERGDNIVGYPKIGPVRAAKLMADPKKRQKLFDDFGKKMYLRNRALIDLTLCPYLLKNISYILKMMSSDIKYDDARIRSIIQKYRVRGLSGEIKRSILPFKFLGS